MEFAKLLLTGTQADIPAFYEEARRFFLAFPKAGDELLQRNREELSASVPFLGEHAAAFLLLVWRDHNEVRARFFSDTGKVRALEFLNALFSEMGLVKGNSADAMAQISQTLLWTQIREREQGDLTEYIMEQCTSYFEDCDWIEAREYAGTHEQEIRSMPRYKKQRIPWSFVRSVDIAPEGSAIYVHSLENEAGIEVKSGSDVIIMIGSQGEVYHMAEDKFDATYEATGEPLDIFANMTVFLPEVRVMPGNEYVNIDEMAHICYPRPGNAIYARKLDRRTKVFPVYDPEGYFLGKPGDYLVVRSDDLTDIYIVQEQIFERTYAQV